MAAGEPSVAGGGEFFTELLSSAVEDDLAVSHCFTKNSGDFFDRKILLIVGPECHEFISLEMTLGDLPEGDGIVGLGRSGLGVIGIEKGKGGLVTSPLRDRQPAGNGEEPGAELTIQLEGSQLLERV